MNLYTGWDGEVVHSWGRSSCTLMGTVNLYTGGDGEVVHWWGR